MKEKHQLEMAEKELQLDQEELQGLDKIRTVGYTPDYMEQQLLHTCTCNVQSYNKIE